MKDSAKGWRSWNRFDWSEALLEHYFGATESTEPVRALVVVGEELVRVVGDLEAQSLEVEELLVERVLRGVGDNNFWFHAKSAAGSSKPNYLAHLITACLAATDLDDADENSYIARLADITGPARGDLNLEVMAELWRKLSIWLAEHSDDYRPLVLPDPGGWSRIGYTVKLAFPSRRDQVALGRVLSSGPDGRGPTSRLGHRRGHRYEQERILGPVPLRVRRLSAEPRGGPIVFSAPRVSVLARSEGDGGRPRRR